METGYPIYAAQEFPEHPEWPRYEAPARWYVRPINTTEN